MKALLLTILISFFSINSYSQKSHIKQSTPFENVLTAMNTNSVELFKNSLSKMVVGGETNMVVWEERLSMGAEKFQKRYGDFSLKDFGYKFDRKESRLIVFFKGEEQIRMRVIKENRKWKLDEK